MSASRLRLDVDVRAEQDVDEIAAHIAKSSRRSAARFYLASDETYADIASAPLRWPVYPIPIPGLPELRKRAVIGFGDYLVFYAVLTNVLQIYRVLHGARDLPKVLAES